MNENRARPFSYSSSPARSLAVDSTVTEWVSGRIGVDFWGESVVDVQIDSILIAISAFDSITLLELTQ